ncbi:MAG: helix-turn-helix domain-containing protein [Lachnospiraceae bacterium]
MLSYLSEQSKRAGSRHFIIPFNRQELADYLCVERSAMSAELGKLKKEGILDMCRSEFWLK